MLIFLFFSQLNKTSVCKWRFPPESHENKTKGWSGRRSCHISCSDDFAAVQNKKQKKQNSATWWKWEGVTMVNHGRVGLYEWHEEWFGTGQACYRTQARFFPCRLRLKDRFQCVAVCFSCYRALHAESVMLLWSPGWKSWSLNTRGSWFQVIDR